MQNLFHELLNQSRLSNFSQICNKLSKRCSEETSTKKSNGLALQTRHEKSTSPAELVPQEILMTIFAHLSPKELMACSAVCNNWRDVALR